MTMIKARRCTFAQDGKQRQDSHTVALLRRNFETLLFDF